MVLERLCLECDNRSLQVARWPYGALVQGLLKVAQAVVYLASNGKVANRPIG